MEYWFECCDKGTVIWNTVREGEEEINTNLAFKMFGDHFTRACETWRPQCASTST